MTEDNSLHFFFNIATIPEKRMVTTYPQLQHHYSIFSQKVFTFPFLYYLSGPFCNCSCSRLENHQISEIFKFAVYNPKWLKRKLKAHVETVA